MNPSKSLMALFFAMFLVAAPQARAGEMVPITAGTYTFYIAKDKLTALKPGAVEALFRDKASKKKARSTLTRKPDGTLIVNITDKMGMKTPTPAKAADAAKPAEKKTAATKPDQKKPDVKKPDEKPVKPAKVQDQAVWDLVVNNKAVKPEQREGVALALQDFAQKHPAEYKRFVDAGPGGFDAAIAGVVEALAKKSDAAAIDDLLVKAAPKAKEGDVPPVTGQVLKDKNGEAITVANAVDRIADLLTNDPAMRDRVAERLNEYILEPKKGYIAQSVFDKDGETKMIDRIKAMAAVWIGKKTKPDQGKAEPVAPAVLYFVIGDNKDLPNGLSQKYPELQTLRDSEARKTVDGQNIRDALEMTLKVYTAEKPVPGKDGNPGEQSFGPFTGQDEQGSQDGLEARWLGFYAAAAKNAKTIYDGAGMAKKDIKDIVTRNEDNSSTPPGSDKTGAIKGGGKRAKGIMSEGFTFDDLYIAGAVSGWIKVPGADGPGRHISIKLYTAREGGQLIDKVGIFDISEPGDAKTASNIYGRRISLAKPGTSDIQLDDTRKDSLHYKVTIGSDGMIKVLNSDGGGLQATTKDLYELRSKQVADGPLVSINGQNYFMSFQAAPKGTYTYYKADAKGNLIDSERLQPANLGVVAEVGKSGFAENMKDYRPLGYMGDKDKDGKPVFYFLKWNEDVANFEYKTCAEATKADSKVKCEVPTDDVPPKADKKDDKPKDDKPKDDKPKPDKPKDDKPKPDKPEGDKPAGDKTDLTDEDKTSAAGFDTSCQYAETAFKDKSGGYFKKINLGEWRLFLNRQDVANAFHICLNNDQTIFTQGVPVGKTALRSSDDSLIVEVVNPSNFIPPDDVVNGNVERSKFKVKDGSVTDINSRSAYFINKDDLTHDGLAALAPKGGNTAYMDKMAWVRFGFSPSKPTEATDMEVKIRAANSGDLDADKTIASVEKAFKLGNATKSTFVNDADRKKLTDFIRGEVIKYKGKGTISTNPNVTIHLNVQREITEFLSPIPIVSLTTNGDETGDKLDNGDPDVRLFTHETLVWCSYPNNGKPYGLETGAQHKAHTKPDEKKR
ncbi:MAG: hypothetical protein HY077_03315 [Elusimicrobia bacterium]|nr:hypothetical protein [Elusimicrobiota bacterium]